MLLDLRKDIVRCQSQIATLEENIGAANKQISRLTGRLRACGVPSEKEKERVVANIVKILSDAYARGIRLPPESLTREALTREARSMHCGVSAKSLSFHLAYELGKLGTAGRAVGEQLFVQLDALEGGKSVIQREIAKQEKAVAGDTKTIARLRRTIAKHEICLAYETETPERDDPPLPCTTAGLRCGGCGKHRPKLEYSASQLKKKGKRRCHSCVGEDAARELPSV